MLPRVTQSSLYQLILVSRDFDVVLGPHRTEIIGDKTDSVRMSIDNLFDVRYGVVGDHSNHHLFVIGHQGRGFNSNVGYVSDCKLLPVFFLAIFRPSLGTRNQRIQGTSCPYGRPKSTAKPNRNGLDKGFSCSGMVPRDGIEPPTRGFSIPCSTN